MAAATSGAVLEVRDVHKAYRRRGKAPEKAVDGLDLTVAEGGVHGFLGPNGSGKTTTIRMLLGLVAADSGSLSLFGRPVPDDLPRLIGQVGALVETPLFFPTFSGRTNLRRLADIAEVSYDRVEEALDLVELRGRADDAFKGYSLGMKQRLGIAAALLKQPRLLILDEPSNGLDPAGIRDVRELIRRLGAGGHTTVFLSSHLLAEVQQVCDHVSILAKGRCVASGAVDEVLASGGSPDVRVEVADPAGAETVLREQGYTVHTASGHLLVRDVADPARLNWVLATHGHWAYGLTRLAPDLEATFLALTESQRVGDGGGSHAPRHAGTDGRTEGAA